VSVQGNAGIFSHPTIIISIVHHTNNVYNANMQTVQSVERAFSILHTVSNHPHGIGAADIAKVVDLPRPTVIRLLNTMQGVSVVVRGADDNLYRIGQSILALSANLPYNRQLPLIARPALQTLADQTGETVYLSIPDGDQTHYIDQIDSQYHIQPSAWIGEKVALHLVADGKLFLASWGQKQLENYLSQSLVSYTPHSITDPDTLHTHLAQVKRQGYAHTQDEFEEGLVAFAAPIVQNGQTIAAVTISYPIYRQPDDGGAEWVRLLRQAAQQISNAM
jgi:DNA-binding IclR family transcriptional regulator